ncbi:WAT1-related protein [Dioscorea alata]|uniref:WAT1-related protein n=1 Tax=Dioscorea alata TaxID=55571 RepID=A0ACB7VBX3_DIOAL|nr:WAT1-related protein [Dioscorea alata]
MNEMKPYIVVILIQFIYTGMPIISKAALDIGLSPFVFVFYRQAFATVMLVPLSIILARKKAPPLSFRLLFKMFILALIGITLSFNLYNVALDYTSATVASAITNSLPVSTFMFAVLLRIEALKVKSKSGIAKVLGITLCLAGILMIAFYTGPQLNHHEPYHHSQQPTHSSRTWIKGSFLMISASTVWSLWLTLQKILLKEYPSKLLFTTMQCMFSSIQSFIVAILFERNIAQWKLHFNMRLLAVAYSGFIVSGVSFYLQSWCIERKGPVFLSMWTPLAFVFTIIGSSFILDNPIYLGSVLGGVFMVGGLYSVLWGKITESRISEEQCILEEEKVCNEEKETASSPCPHV